MLISILAIGRIAKIEISTAGEISIAGRIGYPNTRVLEFFCLVYYKKTKLLQFNKTLEKLFQCAVCSHLF